MHMGMAGMDGNIIQTRRNEFDLSQVAAGPRVAPASVRRRSVGATGTAGRDTRYSRPAYWETRH